MTNLGEELNEVKFQRSLRADGIATRAAEAHYSTMTCFSALCEPMGSPFASLSAGQTCW